VVEDEVEGHVRTIACANAVAQRAPPPALLSNARLRARGAGTVIAGLLRRPTGGGVDATRHCGIRLD